MLEIDGNKDQYYSEQIYMSDIECVFESMSGKGSIFISNYAAAQDIKLLQNKGIKAVLSVARSGLVQHSREDIPFYLYLPAQDHEEYELYKFFNQTFDFIEQARRHTNVLVHCMAGISRSVTIVTAYLLKKFKCSLGEVILMLQRKRNKINPNKGFIEQLKKYAQQEGLKCDFQHQEVPTPRDRSASRGSHHHSASRQKPAPRYGLANPLKKRSEKAEKTAATKEDISNTPKKSEQKPGGSSQPISPLKAQKSALLVVENSENAFEILSPLTPLKKKCSYDSRTTQQKEKMSIQEKITKVREKLQQKEEMRRSLEKKIPAEKQVHNKDSKTHSLRAALQSKKPSNKHLSEYFSLYSKQHAVTLALTQEDQPASKKRNNQEKQSDEFQIYFCETEGEIYPKDYRAESRTLYSKIQQKKVSARTNL